MAAVVAFLPLPCHGQAQGGQPQWKDRAEYDLVQAIQKETDLSKRLSLLSSWKEKYPTSAFIQMRNDLLIQTYAGLRQPGKVIAAGLDALQANPGDFSAMYLMALNVQLLPNPTADDLAAGEKAANEYIAAEGAFFDSSKKPATTSDTAWAEAKTQADVLAHVTLGWIALQKKDDEGAEKEFKKVLELAPNASTAKQWPVDSAQVSSWLGTAIAHEAIQQKKPELYPQALFQFARAASLDQSQGGLPAAARQSYDTYFVNAFNRYHGQDPAEMAKLLAGSDRRGGPRRGAARGRRRFHPRAAGRLRHPRGRARRHAVGRPAPADRHRAGRSYRMRPCCCSTRRPRRSIRKMRCWCRPRSKK